MSNQRPRLSKTDLKAIQDRNPDSADVRALLWEIKRLRITVLRADDFARTVGTVVGPSGQILDILRRQLAEEPVVMEQAPLWLSV